MESFGKFLISEMKTNNEGRGYHGEMKGSETQKDKSYAIAFDKVKAATKEKDDKKIRNFLDSVYGRHLPGHEDDSAFILKNFKKFSISYRPGDYEWN